MPAIRLGRMVLNWCKNCNIPLISRTQCSICGITPESVRHTPPGDIRPAFDQDLELITTLIDTQYGPGTGELFIPENRVIILNRAPDIDRLDEVIFNGEVQGAIRFDLEKQKFRFLPRLPGIKRFLTNMTKGFIIVDDGAIKPILTGSSALCPGIIRVSDDITVGDEIVVLSNSNELLGIGSARKSGNDMVTTKHGVGIKIRWHETLENFGQRSIHFRKELSDHSSESKIVEITDNRQGTISQANSRYLCTGAVPVYKSDGWRKATLANKPTMDEMIADSKKFIKKTIENYELPIAVSFSGGKDSLATLLLVLDAGYKPVLFFIDTGLEFPETTHYVNKISEQFGLKLLVGGPINSFWSGIQYFGPPGKDYRWCCKTCKLGPTTRLIKEHFPKGVLAFIGQRRYESEQRSLKGSVWQNPWVPGQVGVSPIQNWSALHIWLYIFMKQIEFNNLYEQGLERIGCWLCPASDLADFNHFSSTHPDYPRFIEFLKNYASNNSFTEDWVYYGVWRWKKIPNGVKQLMSEKGIKLKILVRDVSESDHKDDELSGQGAQVGLELKFSPGFMDCKYGLSLEGVFNKRLDMERVTNLLNILGETNYDDELGFCTVEQKIDVFSEGGVVIKGKNQNEIMKKAKRLHSTIMRAMECIGCGVCIGRCKNNALFIESSKDSAHFGKVRVSIERCNHCRKCLGPCPVVNFNLDRAFEM